MGGGGGGLEMNEWKMDEGVGVARETYLLNHVSEKSE